MLHRGFPGGSRRGTGPLPARRLRGAAATITITLMADIIMDDTHYSPSLGNALEVTGLAFAAIPYGFLQLFPWPQMGRLTGHVANRESDPDWLEADLCFLGSGRNVESHFPRRLALLLEMTIARGC